ncbi:hypothetical protein VIGAN_11126000 [Vigna angularis var. angularis]|uniref:Uncharacterized protein n=1 Tax=Vigna angularis var. angularis TaxID=157739 RepID=A0A0S3TA59_PHAAN|nr:hypothetical protein VIGAN_11126000 [Vigna angularis var. angularis]
MSTCSGQHSQHKTFSPLSQNLVCEDQYGWCSYREKLEINAYDNYENFPLFLMLLMRCLEVSLQGITLLAF